MKLRWRLRVFTTCLTSFLKRIVNCGSRRSCRLRHITSLHKNHNSASCVRAAAPETLAHFFGYGAFVGCFLPVQYLPRKGL
ncbi:hypothetical protein BDN70DRAFT_308239 [Pholiota conissans]|uniref:Uncharacterized protein n=1 Tax=Pholiota conissans TaxID=109636 RepID=A0A9P6CPG0_9AGAR|nr:hypothetical protein BDN70DRAFT_308239 [Pholiota conissans]